MDAESSPVNDNGCRKSNNDGETETFQWDKVGKYPYSSVGSIEERITLKIVDLWCFLQRLVLILFDM